MFSARELRYAMNDEKIVDSLAGVRQALAANRLGQALELDDDTVVRLLRLIDAVLASAPNWNPISEDLCRQAAEVAEMLAYSETTPNNRSRLRIRAALLYELAAQPAMAGAVVQDGDGPPTLIDFFRRRNAFGRLGRELDINFDSSIELPLEQLIRLAVCEDAASLADFQQGGLDQPKVYDEVAALARLLRGDLSLIEVDAFRRVIQIRAARATRSQARAPLFPSLKAIEFPVEMWGAQVRAIEGGLLDPAYDAWALAAPTGTGKTFLARLLVLDSLERQPHRKILYIVPSKALVYQVASDLLKSLEPTGTRVTAVTPQLVGLDAEEDEQIQASAVLVLTPEKADLLLRIKAEFLGEVGLIVVDEAHHIEEGTRGVLLELYLTRLKATFAEQARYVFLSAVAPNIGDIANWLGQNPGSVLAADRSTRMRVGIYRIGREGRYNRGIIEYVDGTQLRVIESGVRTGKRAGLVQLTNRLGEAGPVLVVAKGKRTAEAVAGNLRKLQDSEGTSAPLSEEQLASEAMQRLDARLERRPRCCLSLIEPSPVASFSNNRKF